MRPERRLRSRNREGAKAPFLGTFWRKAINPRGLGTESPTRAIDYSCNTLLSRHYVPNGNFARSGDSKREMRLFTTTTWKMIVVFVALNCAATPAGATEKYWIAHEAQLIVVGTFHPGRGFLWSDGWHETGTITVNEILYGHSPGNEIVFRLTIRCYNPWWNRWLPRHLMNQFGSTGLWFLRRLDERTWEPANDCDSGYRLLSQRADFERYIRVEKR